MKTNPKPRAIANSHRLVLTLAERLRGWVATVSQEELQGQRLDMTRRALAVIRGLARHGIRARPVSGVVLQTEAAERLLSLLESRRTVD